MSSWHFRYQGFEPEEEKLREALCTLGNGYFATRGAAPGSVADAVHYPGTYRAGLYDRRGTTIQEKTVENEDLVNLPNWLWLTFTVDGRALEPESMEVLEYVQELDLARGVLTRIMQLRDDRGRESRVLERRLVSMDAPHLAALQVTITPLNWSGQLEIVSGVDAGVENTLVHRYRALESRHLEVEHSEEIDGDGLLLVTRTIQSRIRIAQAVRTRVLEGDRVVGPERTLRRENGRVAHRMLLHAREGTPYTADKVVALFTSLDRAISEPAYDARRALADAGGFAELLGPHVVAWDHLWDRCGMDVDGREGTERVVRLYTFHILQTASAHTMDLDVGVPARGWTGEAYRGHIFWDELFIFPMLMYRVPEVTRSLLMYRYRRLDEARRAAREAGYAGAMFPWQSGSNGEEESQEVHLNPKSGRWTPDHSYRQRHINAAIPYSVWLHHQVTGDREFFDFYGAEIILETARFWGSLARYDRTKGRYEIRGVMGPDEFHEAYPGAEEPGLNNNAYTNVMATWVLCRALDVLEMLPEPRLRELQEDLSLDREEIDCWRDISQKMFVPFQDDGIIEQFEGWSDLEELDWSHYRSRYDDLHRLDRILESEDDSADRYRISKQADVLMLFFLLSVEELTELFERLGYPWNPERISDLVDHYLHRTSHGSTLSSVVHSWILSRQDRAHSWHFFRRAVESDVSDVQGGTTPEGIHLGAMAGTVDLLLRCYTGLEARGDILRLNPYLPEELPGLSFSVQYRGVWLRIGVTPDRLTVAALPGRAKGVDVAVGDETVRLEPGRTIDFAL